MKIKINRLRLMMAIALIVEIGLCWLSNPYVNLAAFCILGSLFCAYGSKVVADPNESELKTLQRVSKLMFGCKAEDTGDFEEEE